MMSDDGGGERKGGFLEEIFKVKGRDLGQKGFERI